jgi:hypothetical protein
MFENARDRDTFTCTLFTYIFSPNSRRFGVHTGFNHPAVELPNLTLRQNLYGAHESNIVKWPLSAVGNTLLAEAKTQRSTFGTCSLGALHRYWKIIFGSLLTIKSDRCCSGYGCFSRARHVTGLFHSLTSSCPRGLASLVTLACQRHGI